MMTDKAISAYLKQKLKEIKKEHKLAWDTKNYADLLRAEAIINFLDKCIHEN